MLESIQIVIDIACKIAARYNLGNPQNYKECLQLLHHHDYIDRDLMERTTAMVGLRNLLVHEYTRLDRARLLEALDHLEDFRTFIRAVTKQFLQH
ncbi:type VII toxin-antitoxin system HepT family RNase toxin [Nitratifractor sp.]